MNRIRRSVNWEMIRTIATIGEQIFNRYHTMRHPVQSAPKEIDLCHIELDLLIRDYLVILDSNRDTKRA